MDVLAGARQLYMCFFPGAISFNATCEALSYSGLSNSPAERIALHYEPA